MSPASEPPTAPSATPTLTFMLVHEYMSTYRISSVNVKLLERLNAFECLSTVVEYHTSYILEIFSTVDGELEYEELGCMISNWI